MEKARAMDADAVFAYSRETVAEVLDFTGDSCGAGVVVIATSNPVALELATKVSARNSKINASPACQADRRSCWMPTGCTITRSLSQAPLPYAENAR